MSIYPIQRGHEGERREWERPRRVRAVISNPGRYIRVSKTLRTLGAHFELHLEAQGSL